MLKFLKLPFLNLSNIFLLEEKQVMDKMGSNPTNGFGELGKDGKEINPLEPHFSIFKQFLQKFKNKPKAKKISTEESAASKASAEAFRKLVGSQLDVMSDRINFIEETEEIVNHEKKQVEVNFINQSNTIRGFSRLNSETQSLREDYLRSANRLSRPQTQIHNNLCSLQHRVCRLPTNSPNSTLPEI